MYSTYNNMSAPAFCAVYAVEIRKARGRQRAREFIVAMGVPFSLYRLACQLEVGTTVTFNH